jgi:hypothetical protein
VLQRILLLPLLSPLLAVLLVAALNPKPAVSVRLLTWSSPAWPLGGWLAAASGLGAMMSAGGTALALQGQAAATPARRQVRRRSESPGSQERGQRDLADNWDEPPVATPRPTATWAGPPRSAGEPAPTVSVPFRVIRKGSAPARTPAAAAQPAASSEANDWNTPLSEDW